MPISTCGRRSGVPRQSGRTLHRGRVVLIALCGLVAAPGCRTDQAARPGLARLSPSGWFAKSPAEDEFELKPVPQSASRPLAPAGRAVVPLAPPSESASPGSFYGVRPTGAEEEAPANGTWSARFRKLFRRGAADAPLQPVPTQETNWRSAGTWRWPPQPAPAISGRGAMLGRPVIESSPPAALARHVEPYRGSSVKPIERLPRIFPRMPWSSLAKRDPAPWPHAPRKEFADAPETEGPLSEPRPLPALASQTAQGPSLFR